MFNNISHLGKCILKQLDISIGERLNDVGQLEILYIADRRQSGKAIVHAV